MLRSLNELTGFTLKAIDQQVGYCKDFIFDDRTWTLRYIVADSNKWLPMGRKRLISPLLLAEPIWQD
ncbi:MAG: hypothetical protein ACI9A2_004521 [Halioglobus sp.]|jgi:hypothetical protein